MNFLNKRKLVQAATLTGPRVYSTDLHASHLQPENLEYFVGTTARALKSKMLTKGTVTVHMSHLLSPGGILFLECFPDVLQCRALLPAFREDKDSVADYVKDHEAAYRAAGIDDTRVVKIISLLENSFERVMPWQLGNVHTQYRDRIVAGLIDPSSIARRLLLGANGQKEAQIDAIAQQIAAGDFSEDGSMRRFLSEADAAIRPILVYYEQAIYHMVGTSVVNCESGTDLSPASSFSAMSVAENDDRVAQPGISNTDVFTRLFLGEALEAMQSEATPVTVLDTMPFEYVDRINQRFREAKFHDRYDDVVKAVIRRMNTNTPEAFENFDSEAFATMASSIHNEFVSEIEKEIRDYNPTAYKEARAEAIGQTQKIGLSIAGMVTGLGSLLTVYRLGKGYMSLLKAARNAGDLATADGFQMLGPEKKKEKLVELIEKAELSENSRTKLLDGAKLICDFNAAKVARL